MGLAARARFLFVAFGSAAKRLVLVAAVSCVGGVTEGAAVTALVGLIGAMAGPAPHVLSRMVLGHELSVSATQLFVVCTAMILVRAAAELTNAFLSSRLATDYARNRWLG